MAIAERMQLGEGRHKGISDIAQLSRKDIISDLERVISAELRKLPIGAQISGRLDEYISRRLGISQIAVCSERKRLSEKYNTDALLYAFHEEYGLSYESMIDAAYMPALNHLAEYVKRDKELISIMRETRQRGISIAVLSNSNSKVAEAMLDSMGIYGMFDAVVTVESFGGALRPKPYAEAYLLALRKIGAENPHNAIFIDDKESNLVEPKRLGMTTMLADPSDGKVATEADYIVKDFAELLRSLNCAALLC